jgi:2-(1,2-epoxy-1,2-dihydrophenyl)acetyl-CoA isomerase
MWERRHSLAGKEVRLEKTGGVATVTLDRPEVRNALSPDAMGELASALDECRGPQVRAVVVTGAGGAFCSGADVRAFTDVLEEGPERLSAHLRAQAGRLHREVILAIRTLPKPVIAAIDGVAAGGGLGLALACDLRLASEKARFFMAYAGIGATADGGSTYYLPRLLGPALAMEMYLVNQPISAERALEMGLVNRVVPHEELGRHAAELAGRLASGPTAAFGQVKALMDASWSADLESQLDAETAAISDIALTHDFQEGVTAFVEKRAPRFRGQ